MPLRNRPPFKTRNLAAATFSKPGKSTACWTCGAGKIEDRQHQREPGALARTGQNGAFAVAAVWAILTVFVVFGVLNILEYRRLD